MKKILVILGLVVSTVSFGQKKTTMSYAVGAQTLISTKSNDISNGVVARVVVGEGDTKAVFSVGAAQLLNAANSTACQFPLLAGLSAKLTNKVSFGVSAGWSFFNVDGSKARFTYSPSITLDAGKFDFDIKHVGTLFNGGDLNQVGVGVMYKF
jgi:opacity protein-like surface antigen